MKAIVFSQTGGPEVLALADIPNLVDSQNAIRGSMIIPPASESTPSKNEKPRIRLREAAANGLKTFLASRTSASIAGVMNRYMAVAMRFSAV